MRRLVMLPVPAILALLALAPGCTPHDGEVTGDYVSYFAAGSSENLYRLEAKQLDFSEASVRARFGFDVVDCRELDAASENERLDGALTDADGNEVDYDTACGATPDFFPWINQYPYYVKQDTYEPFRTEAVMTTEGALQLTIHANIEKIGDFRFGWVVNPQFQPVECVDSDDGAQEVEVDDTNGDIDREWLTNWSLAEDGGTLFHLNAYSYQINPSNTAEFWSLPPEWQAGYGFARFADEDFYGHGIDYVDNVSAGQAGYGTPLYLNSYDGHWGSASSYPNFLEKLTSAVTYDDSHPSDLTSIGKSDFPLNIKVEDNSWRPDNIDPEDQANGFANWVGLDPTWVHFDASPEELAKIATGRQDKPIEGDFQLYVESASAASKVLVNGRFKIDNVREDIWGYSPSLEERKVEENNTPTCGEDRLTTTPE